jgi:hypothetical protein
MLVRSVAVLALPCEGQIEWLELEAGVLLVGQFEDAQWLKPSPRQAISDIDRFLEE